VFDTPNSLQTLFLTCVSSRKKLITAISEKFVVGLSGQSMGFSVSALKKAFVYPAFNETYSH
jgi:hypothetical protein